MIDKPQNKVVEMASLGVGSVMKGAPGGEHSGKGSRTSPGGGWSNQKVQTGGGVGEARTGWLGSRDPGRGAFGEGQGQASGEEL